MGEETENSIMINIIILTLH